MSKLIDMTGKRIGALTVTGRAPSDTGRTLWACLCDCGKECVQEAYNLMHGRVTSCGCGITRNERRKGKGEGMKVDYTGQTFGRLTAVRRVARGKWLWKCACGGETIASPSNVRNGKPASCGCALRESARERASDPDYFGHFDGTSVSVIRSIAGGNLRSTNTSGHTGVRVRRSAATVSYSASITVRGKWINLGTYAMIEDAITARKDAERKYFGTIIDNYDFEHPKKEEKQNAD